MILREALLWTLYLSFSKTCVSAYFRFENFSEFHVCSLMFFSGFDSWLIYVGVFLQFSRRASFIFVFWKYVFRRCLAPNFGLVSEFWSLTTFFGRLFLMCCNFFFLCIFFFNVQKTAFVTTVWPDIFFARNRVVYRYAFF